MLELCGLSGPCRSHAFCVQFERNLTISCRVMHQAFAPMLRVDRAPVSVASGCRERGAGRAKRHRGGQRRAIQLLRRLHDVRQQQRVLPLRLDVGATAHLRKCVAKPHTEKRNQPRE